MASLKSVNPDFGLEALLEAAEKNMPLGPELNPPYLKIAEGSPEDKALRAARNRYMEAFRLLHEGADRLDRELAQSAAFKRLSLQAQAEERKRIRAKVGEQGRALALEGRGMLVALRSKIAAELYPAPAEPESLTEVQRQTRALEAVARDLRVNDKAAELAYQIRRQPVGTRQAWAVKTLEQAWAEHGEDSEQVGAIVAAVRKCLFVDELPGLVRGGWDQTLEALRRPVLSREEQARVDLLKAQIEAPAFLARRLETRIRAGLKNYGLGLPVSPLDQPVDQNPPTGLGV